jgi:hypothetical protein
MARMMMLKAAVVLRFLGKVAMGCWAWSGTMLLGCVLLYWVYGGFFALLLLCIALAGIVNKYFIVYSRLNYLCLFDRNNLPC